MLPATVVERARAALKRHSLLTAVIMFLFFAAMPFSGSSAMAAGEVSTSAKSYMLLEATTGRVLSEKNSDQKLPMASTTKIMTCLLACELGDMKDVVTVGKESVGLDGTSIYLKDGETITLKDLCYGLMLNSGNDAAMAIAVHLGGSQEGFAELMNKRAKEIGANNTNFVTPNGLPNDDHYTTAHDLALIAAEAMQNELFTKIVGTKSLTLEADEDSPIRYLKSKNKILYQYDGGNGVKTGYTKAAGKCLVAGAKRDGMQLIAVVLNDYDMFNDCKKLLDYGFANYKWTDVTGDKYFENKVKIINGLEGTADVEQMEDIYLPLSKEDSKIEKKYEIYEGINAPVEKGARVGTAKYILNGEVVKKVPLYLAQSVEENTWSYWLGRILQDWLGTKGKELRVT